MIKQLRLHRFFNKDISIAPLVIFRIIFGALMIYGTLRFLLKGWVFDNYITPKFHFGYYGFEWVEKLPGNWMYLPFILLLIAAFGILLGAFYRTSAITAFLTFTYIELLDKTYYLNHYYFVSLVLFLLIFLPANKALSLDVFLGRIKAVSVVKSININIVKFQLAIVYIFAGIAKIESDWLFKAQPLKIWLNKFHHLPLVGDLLAADVTAYVFAWFGCFYDLFIVFFLFKNSTRKYAYFFVVVFHIVTWLLFPIGVFPWVMIFSTLIFFPANFHQSIITRLKELLPKAKTNNSTSVQGSTSKIKLALFSFFILFQVLIPFRYLVYPGDLFWNEEGFRFSWRVMLMHKEGLATFFVENPETGKQLEIVNSNYLTVSQEKQMATQPDFLIQYGKILYDEFKDTTLQFGEQKIHINEPIIRADVKVSLNGRLNQQFVTKKHNFANFKYDLKHRNWLELYKK